MRTTRELRQTLLRWLVLKCATDLRNSTRWTRHVLDALERDRTILRPSTILGLQRAALQDLSRYAGNYRPGDVQIRKSAHQPPGSHMVAGLLEEMCDYVNEGWETSNGIHLSAYVMWRLNWIHPFADGNGRTSRAASYLVLCAKALSILPGRLKIPDQIVETGYPILRRWIPPMPPGVMELSMSARWRRSFQECWPVNLPTPIPRSVDRLD